jgi:hypothetical protein
LRVFGNKVLRRIIWNQRESEGRIKWNNENYYKYSIWSLYCSIIEIQMSCMSISTIFCIFLYNIFTTCFGHRRPSSGCLQMH